MRIKCPKKRSRFASPDWPQTPKELVRRVLNALPDSATLEDIWGRVDDAEFEEMVARAKNEVKDEVLQAKERTVVENAKINPREKRILLPPKDAVRAVLEALPSSASWWDIRDAVTEEELKWKIERGLQDAEEGNFYTQKQVERMAKKWLKAGRKKKLFYEDDLV